MARIRTIKPEAFTSESLAEVSVTAERTFFGLLTQADDHGRFRDNAAIIAGLLWPLRADHTPVDVEGDLQQLAAAGLLCRYTGCDGRHYLHVVTWFEHQKIDKPSQSRIPACPHHHDKERCGACKGTCVAHAVAEEPPTPRRKLPETSASPPVHGASPSDTSGARSPSRRDDESQQRNAPDRAADHRRQSMKKTAGQKRVTEPSAKAPRTLPEDSAPGSRILDPGSTEPSGRTAPATSRSAQELIGEYVANCNERPPGDVVGHLGRVTKKLLDEGIDPKYIRTGLTRFAAKPMHPSVLASLVNEAMNASPGGLARPETRPNVPGHKAWANPADPAAYAEEL